MPDVTDVCDAIRTVTASCRHVAVRRHRDGAPLRARRTEAPTGVAERTIWGSRRTSRSVYGSLQSTPVNFRELQSTPLNCVVLRCTSLRQFSPIVAEGDRSSTDTVAPGRRSIVDSTHSGRVRRFSPPVEWGPSRPPAPHRQAGYAPPHYWTESPCAPYAFSQNVDDFEAGETETNVEHVSSLVPHEGTRRGSRTHHPDASALAQIGDRTGLREAGPRREVPARRCGHLGQGARRNSHAFAGLHGLTIRKSTCDGAPVQGSTAACVESAERVITPRSASSYRPPTNHREGPVTLTLARPRPLWTGIPAQQPVASSQITAFEVIA